MNIPFRPVPCKCGNRYGFTLTGLRTVQTQLYNGVSIRVECPTCGAWSFPAAGADEREVQKRAVSQWNTENT